MRPKLLLSSEDFVSNLGPHFCSLRASPLEFEFLLGRGMVDLSSKSSFFNASLAHGHMEALLGRSCTSDQAKHMFFRSYTALVSLCNDAHHSFSCENQQCVLYSLLMDPTTSDM